MVTPLYRLWLRELEDIDPELAKQIHVFSSFFYKKLNKKKYVSLPFYHVLGHTVTILSASKKVTIVFVSGPQNLICFRRNTSSCQSMKSLWLNFRNSNPNSCASLHWYLAIIYEPEHVLRPPASQRQTRSHSAPKPLSKAVETIPTRSNSPIVDCDGQRGQTISENEVEEGLHDFQSSCSITATSRDSSTTTTTPREQSTTATIQGATCETPSSDLIDVEMDNPLVEEVTDSMDHTPYSSKARSHSPMKEDDSRQPTSDREVEIVQDAPGSNGIFNYPPRDIWEHSAGIPPSKFYGSLKNAKDKQKEIDLSPMEIHDDAEELCESSVGQPQ